MFMSNGSSIGASHIGNRPECLAMLKLAAEKKLYPMVETVPISAKGCAEAVSRVAANKIKYRFTLTDYDKAFWCARVERREVSRSWLRWRTL